MPKLKNCPPKLCQDGKYAVVYAGGKKIRLGIYGSEEAQIRYHRFLQEWIALGYAATIAPGSVCLIDELALIFLEYSKENSGCSDYGNYKNAIETVLELYSGISVSMFGPKALITVQNTFVKRGYARKYCNKLTNMVKTIFRWGVAQELVPVQIAQALNYVPPLRKGRTNAKESVPRLDVHDDVIELTLPLLYPTIAAMVQVQRYSGMRPDEICQMCVGDIDRSREVWCYQPQSHKNGWRGQERYIFLGKPEQELILPRLADKALDQHVFSPRDTLAERKAKDAANRKTPMQPSQVARMRKRAKAPKRIVRDNYDSNSYRKAISTSIKIANESRNSNDKIPHWTPYQLRHAAATEITEAVNLDAARAVLGQKSINTTKIYNHADSAIAEKVAKNRSKRLNIKGD